MRKSLFAVSLLSLALAACDDAKDPAAPAATASEGASPAAVATVSAEEGARIAHDRHEGFEATGKSMEAVGDELKKPAPNVDAIKAAAAKLAEAAPKARDWFPAGSGPDVAPKSDALPAIWEKPAEFQQAMDKFVAEAATFNTTAQGGDLAAIGGGMKALGGTCKGCHDQFKKKDD